MPVNFFTWTTMSSHIFFYPMPWKIQPIRGRDYRCIFCGMLRVVFHSTFPSLLARNSLLGSIWGLLKSQLRNSSIPANHYEHFRSRPENFPKISEHFRRLPKIFPKILKNHKNIWKLLLDVQKRYLFRRIPNTSEDYRSFSENFKKS